MGFTGGIPALCNNCNTIKLDQDDNVPKRKTGIAAEFSGFFSFLRDIFRIANALARKADVFGTRRQLQEARLAYLRDKYKDEALAWRIFKNEFWEGQTAIQLTDSLGTPAAKDDLLLKTRKREIWKYNQTGRNRYGLRITLDDDRVVAWDQKA